MAKKTGLEALPLWAKIILALPALDIIWVAFRIYKSCIKHNFFGVLLGIALLIIGIPFLWLVDIITLVVSNKVYWID
jgi:hypothetical protein